MTPSSKSFLIIQTAFLGDVILATALVEKLHISFPEASISFLVRKGNESLLKDHPFLRDVLVWDKKKGKIKNLLKMISTVRSKKYDYVINVHRFTSSGLITCLSQAKHKIGFDKNPLSFFFDKKVRHEIGQRHEVERNHELIKEITDEKAARPRLYPSTADFNKVKEYNGAPYICIAPTSVWFTKQFPAEKWIEFVQQIAVKKEIYLLGASTDNHVCESIRLASGREGVTNLAGTLSLLESAALIKDADMNYVNDSAPMHLASAMNAPVTAIYCSTVPAFGFGPLSDNSFIAETREQLSCRPCGLHGFRDCPQGHFKCARTIETQELISRLR